MSFDVTRVSRPSSVLSVLSVGSVGKISIRIFSTFSSLDKTNTRGDIHVLPLALTRQIVLSPR